ncbi:MAG TPA: type II toxin-antitoxin system VapC family toxin [Agitococcus sp.]|nr:type II toxin-antitoxin system VapC family toxin [Agitococcus sp.]HMX98725.1 type II toxin-antitoxin system VapC family toxin [Agitococcus sp.]
MSLIYLLDTNTISEPLKAEPNQQVMENIARYHAQIAIAAVVFYELVRGMELLPDSKKRLKTMDYIDSVVVKFSILPYTQDAAKWHGETAARLQQQGKTPPFVDTQIAAVAKTNNLILVTRNVDDFKNFTDLKIENWFC